MASSTEIPATMRSLALETKYGPASSYKCLTLPVPELANPTDVLVRVRAAAVNAGDTKIAKGMFHFMMASTFPYKFAHDLSGVVAAVGSDVTSVAVGDEVVGMLPIQRGGAASEYAIIEHTRLTRKPAGLTHTQAAALPQVCVTAYQVLSTANTLLAGGLGGKTIFVPAGLSGCGSAAILMGKRVFGVARVITTVSTSKLARLDELLGVGTVDLAIDYTCDDPLVLVARESVDCYFDTIGGVMGHLSLMKRDGAVVSITHLGPGKNMERLMPTPWVMKLILDAVYGFNRWRVGRWGVRFEAQLTVLQPGDLETIVEWVEQGRLPAVPIGRTAKLSDLDAVRTGCTEAELGKGGVGKFVIEID